MYIFDMVFRSYNSFCAVGCCFQKKKKKTIWLFRNIHGYIRKIDKSYRVLWIDYILRI